MLKSVVFSGFLENKKGKFFKIVLQEKNGNKKVIISVKKYFLSEFRNIINNNSYNGIFYTFIDIITKFGFEIKCIKINIPSNVSSIVIISENNDEIILSISTSDAVILATYIDIPLTIDDSSLQNIELCNEEEIFINSSLSDYSIAELKNMLNKARFDDSFLEEAAKIRDEIKRRLKYIKSQHDEGPDFI